VKEEPSALASDHSFNPSTLDVSTTSTWSRDLSTTILRVDALRLKLRAAKVSGAVRDLYSGSGWCGGLWQKCGCGRRV